ncbi:hypothetical protein GGS21DRAFT_509045 [Xylaria nigripes]|nr:hypothetical protein GGS21DRAFT_509045 [Xylaria nigripes]
MGSQFHKFEMATNTKQQPEADAAPPSYDASHTTSLSRGDIDQLTSAFSSLHVPLVAQNVSPDTCLAHLKLLYAFQNLKETIGYTDGLWNLYDNRIFPNRDGTIALKKTEELDDDTKKKLSLLREKRWALYVARATDRYEAWWNGFSKDPLTEKDMLRDTTRYSEFTCSSNATAFAWTRNMLPPLDVLLVWHAHMLNPRDYTEDCMRQGLRDLWHAGIPWRLVSEAIDTNFNYIVSSDCISTWEKTIRRKWDNIDDPFIKILPPCPDCNTKNVVTWSTCGLPEASYDKSLVLTGQGYGDSNFKTTCLKCGLLLKRDYLEVFKFSTDVQNLLAHDRPMPGTILDMETGKADVLESTSQRTFANRLIRLNLRSRLYSPRPASLNAVRDIIEEALGNSDVIKHVERVASADLRKTYKLGQVARLHIRKMMSRYWGNSSPFSLELGGAVLRQGIFTEKMHKMDWLHSPAARETMDRLITKYKRFAAIMGKYPRKIAIPTLDVDLAWHTHQLSPAGYYKWMCSKTKRFIDHDDKIDETRLSKAFEWTSKVYQEMNGEVYSECTCWYCESVRAGHSSGLANMLPILKSERDKASDKFHETGRAAFCPPSNSAHISAHNSVQVIDHKSSVRDRVLRQLHLRHRKQLEENYEKARRRAKRKGRDLPPRDEYYYYYWGAPYLLYGPYVYPNYCVCPIYYDATTVAAGSGYYGACAAGTCAGTVAAGACGGAVVGACGGGSAVGCGSASGSACGGGGGGGCGGGCGGS